LEKDSFYIETYGCTSNKFDSYIISDLLNKSKLNYRQTNLENAQFIIINTCGVKEQTENKIKARLKDLHELYQKDPNRHIIIAGCLPHIAPRYIDVIKKVIPSFSAIIDLNNINEITKIIQKIKNGKKNLVFTSKASLDKAKFFVDFPYKKVTGIVPISQGCLGSCTYCCVKNARGKLKCYNPKNIVENVKYQLKKGIKQIYLTSQDCSIYNYNGKELVDLIRSIINLDNNFFLRIGMINPSFLIDKLDQLITIFKFEKVYQFLHIPIQSGSNKILELMRRPYLISDVTDQIEILRKKFPYLTISTDIICGFPGETEYDFYRTVNFIKWLKPEILNISKFTARPGTNAKKMKQLESNTIKERSRRLSKIFRNSLTCINKKWEGWKGEILVIRKSSEKGQAFGRNFAYKNVFINNYNDEYSKFVNIQINKIDGFNLFGKIIINNK
ncbi:MAG: tRNA (N(6)-L-threonylcarbamoyladenosine(37)-C(2))-methylthiotransferase, partial [Promethearchaeota archaeon]